MSTAETQRVEPASIGEDWRKGRRKRVVEGVDSCQHHREEFSYQYTNGIIDGEEAEQDRCGRGGRIDISHHQHHTFKLLKGTLN